jgi:transglutaminase-like putative cysteine protease
MEPRTDRLSQDESLAKGVNNHRQDWNFLLLPGILLIEAIFLGTTFRTLAETLFAFASILLVTVLLWQWQSFRKLSPSCSETQESLFKKTAESSSDASGSSWLVPEFHRLVASLGTKRRLRDGKSPLPESPDRRWRIAIPAILIVIVLSSSWRVGDHFSGNLNPVAMFVDSLAHAVFWTSAVLWMFYPRQGHPAMLGCGLVLVLMAVTAGGVSHSITGQLVAALAAVIAFLFASDYILSRWQEAKETRARIRSGKRQGLGRRLGRAGAGAAQLPAAIVSLPTDSGRTGTLFTVLALSVFLMSTSLAGHLAAAVVPGLQLEFFDRLSQSLEAVTSNSIVGGTRYVRGSRLGSVRRHMLGDPAETAIRAYADSPPGYLRGSVFDYYEDGAWKVINERSYLTESEREEIKPRAAEVTMPAQIQLNGMSTKSLDRFDVFESPAETLVGTIEVHNVPLKGQLVFSALNTTWMEASTYGAKVTHNDLVASRGVDTAEPYVLGISSDSPRDQLGEFRTKLFRYVPRRIGDSIKPVAEQVCRDRLTARSKAKAIEDFFQDNFKYSLNRTVSPGEVDPIVHFLTIRHPAHCEFFASAAAMMLRSVDVPTRYVTGYVVDEKSDEDDFWIARNRDAHAWVEAYDEITETWFPVEATVGRSYLTLAQSRQQLDSSGADYDGLDRGEEDDSLISYLLGWLLSVRTSDSLILLFRIAQLPLFCLVVGLLWYRHRQRLRNQGDPDELASRQMLARVDRKLKRLDLVRDPGETLHQFAARVERAVDRQPHPSSATFLKRAAGWYRDFASARYRGLRPKPLDGTPGVAA